MAWRHRMRAPRQMPDEIRPGEVRTPIDPGSLPGDARLIFIGRARTPWISRENCPKNLREARERGGSARIEIDPPWRLGLRDLAAGEAITVLTWLQHAPRDHATARLRPASSPSARRSAPTRSASTWCGFSR